MIADVQFVDRDKNLNLFVQDTGQRFELAADNGQCHVTLEGEIVASFETELQAWIATQSIPIGYTIWDARDKLEKIADGTLEY